MEQQNEKMLAVIPARAGSKRLPGKNKRLLGDLPLIAWTIRAAIASGVFVKVLVSTDDQEIADIARRQGASVPWLRPAELSTDTATSMDVVLHAADRAEAAGMSFGHVVLLQPTSPFRTAKTIKVAVGQYLSGGAAPMVSVSPAKTHPELCYSLKEEGRMVKYCADRSITSLRSQDWPAAYEVNGVLYAAPVCYLRNQRTFFGPDTRAFLMMSPAECIDIDDDWDWQLATCVAASMFGNAEAFNGGNLG